MKAKIILSSGQDTTITASEMVTEDGFIKFKDAAVDNSPVEEEVWLPLSAIKCIIWKDKLWVVPKTKETKQD